MRHIKLYEQYVESLNELSAKPYYWKWATNKTATFDSIDDSFTVMFFPNNEDHTYMVHYESKRYGTNQSGPGSIGNAMRVLATVMDITIAFLDENPEYSAEFIGDKEEDEKEGPTKRDRIYKNMMSDLPDNYKWELGSDKKTIRISRNLVLDESNSQEKNKIKILANKAGYNIGPVYHGTDVEFTVFDPKKAAKIFQDEPLKFHFAFDKEKARTRGGTFAPAKYVLECYLKGTKRGTYDDDDNLIPSDADYVQINNFMITVRDSSQIKLADPVTYDDNDEEIPLYKRFDSKNKDIRY